MKPIRSVIRSWAVWALVPLATLPAHAASTMPDTPPPHPHSVVAHIDGEPTWSGNPEWDGSFHLDHKRWTAPIFPLEDTFKLESNPGADVTFYLDYKAFRDIPKFDLDGDPSRFGTMELYKIQKDFYLFSELFSYLDVNFTTRDPGNDALVRSSETDTKYGARIVFNVPASHSGDFAGKAVGRIGEIDDTPFVMMASKFSAYSTGAHEVGHLFNLWHNAGNVPVLMTYNWLEPNTNKTVSRRWDYTPLIGEGASDKTWHYSSVLQDDLKIITTESGVGYRDDDHGGTMETASRLIPAEDPHAFWQRGIIERDQDQDFFAFTIDERSEVDLSVVPPASSFLNRFVETVVIDADGVPVFSGSGTVRIVLDPGTYYLRVDGTSLAACKDGIRVDDYSSIGSYLIQGTLTPTLAPIVEWPPTLDDARMLVHAAHGERTYLLPDTSILLDLVKNEEIAEGRVVDITARIAPTNGTVEVLGNAGWIRYTPDPGFRGTDAFTYFLPKVGGGTVSATATFNVGTNGNPQVANDTYRAMMDVPFRAFVPVLANDSDPEHRSLKVCDYDQPANGTVTMDESGYFTYTSNPGFTGEDRFTYTVTDGRSPDAVTATVSVNVTNLPPSITAKDFEVASGGVVLLDGLLADAKDANGNAIAIARISTPENGRIASSGDGTFRYTADAGFVGMESLVFTATDGHSEVTAPLFITVRLDDAANGFARNDQVTTAEETRLVFDPRANDPAEGLTVTQVTRAANGTVTILPDGRLQYDPDADFFGADAFGYTVRTPDGRTESAQVRVTVEGRRDTPVGVDDVYEVYQGQKRIVFPLENDRHPDGALPLEIRNPGSNGATQGDWGNEGPTAFGYKPDADFVGTTRFLYYPAEPGTGTPLGSAASITFHVLATPTLDDRFALDAATPLQFDVLANDLPEPGDTLSVVAFTRPKSGRLERKAGGVFLYTPNDGFTGTDGFRYTVLSGRGLHAEAAVTLEVTATDHPFVARDDTLILTSADAVTIPVLANDGNANGEPLSIVSHDEPENGRLVLNDDATFSYTANPGFFGEDRFTYTAGNGSETRSATVAVDVKPRPVFARSDVVTTPKGHLHRL